MHFNIKRVEKVVLRRKKAKVGKTHCFTCIVYIQNAPTPALIYHDFLPTFTHAHNYITPSLDSLHPNEQVYMHFNIKRVEKVVLRRKKAKVGKTHCFTCFKMRLHLRWSTTIFSQLPHMRTTISPDLWICLHPYEQVYMHFNIKRVEKVVLSRKKAKVGKTHCFTCFKMRLHLRWSTTIFSQLPHMRTTISPDLWIVYIPMNRSTCILTLKESKKSC